MRSRILPGFEELLDLVMENLKVFLNSVANILSCHSFREPLNFARAAVRTKPCFSNRNSDPPKLEW